MAAGSADLSPQDRQVCGPGFSPSFRISMIRPIHLWSSLALLSLSATALGDPSTGITNVIATTDNILLQGRSDGRAVAIFEVEPFQPLRSAATNQAVAVLSNQIQFSTEIRRYNDSHDRAYSSFIVIESGNTERILGTNHFLESFQGVTRDEQPFPSAASKKGLQIQMIDDALA